MTEIGLDASKAAPVARRDSHVRRIHGETLVDPYHWLSERDSPEVLEYLEAENRHTAAAMRHTEDLQSELFHEMLSRLLEDDITVPVRIDDYFYYSRTEKGSQYPIRCRKLGSLEAAEEVLLDLNELAADRPHLDLGVFQVSPDHRLLAYSLEADGSEAYSLRVLDLETREHLEAKIENTGTTLVWANDSQTFFYVVLDAAQRPYRAYRHVLGRSAAHDELVFDEADERFFVSLFAVRSRAYLGLRSESKSTTEIHVLEADRPTDGFRCLIERHQGVEVSIDHHSDYFYVLSNRDAVNFRLCRFPVAGAVPDSWQEIVGHRLDVELVSVDCFRKHLVLQIRRDGLRGISVLDLETDDRHRITFEEAVYTVAVRDNPEFDTEELRLAFSSPITPPSVLSYDMSARSLELLKRTTVLGGYDRRHYEVSRIHAETQDGVQVPISVLHARGIDLDGSHRCLLTAYGAYGISNEPRFVPSRLSLVDRGFVVAIAHVRGGGELGRPWYQDGKLLKKQNTFGDFIAAAEKLVEVGFTSTDRLAIRGGSAGGLLIGAVINQRPDLFAAAIADVPFVDLINTMLDPEIPLTVTEFEEWGDPRDAEFFHYMLAYSPYDQVVPQVYPCLLVTAGLKDPRVQYWEPAKWTAKLRTLDPGPRRLLLDVRMTSGHGGASGRYDSMREEAFRQAFLIDSLK